MSDYDCPSCSESFDTDRGVKVHHARAHGESIAFDTVECDWCGESFEKRVSETDRRESNYCSRDCWGNHQSEQQTGDENPVWKGGISKCGDITCTYCDDDIDREYVDPDQEHVFCDRACTNAWQSDELTGSDHPRWAVESVPCDHCGTVLERPPSLIRESMGNFCDATCQGEWQTEHRTGDDNPLWEGGSVGYGESWYRERARVRDRDENTCQRCGYSQSADDGWLPVHHFIPVRAYDDPNDAHFMSNMAQLCRTCHNHADAELSVRTQREEFL